jgi:hypothetical protein
VNQRSQLLKSVVRDIRTLRSMGTGGGRLPPVTRYEGSDVLVYSDATYIHRVTRIYCDHKTPAVYQFVHQSRLAFHIGNWLTSRSPSLRGSFSMRNMAIRRFASSTFSCDHEAHREN